MKLIIDIPEDVYTRLFDNGIQDNEIAVDDICEMARALRLGTPLPKGHGRLIEVTNQLEQELFTFTRYTGIDEYPYESATLITDNAPTIIEADKESDEQEKIDDYRDRLDELEREEYYESKYTKGESEC